MLAFRWSDIIAGRWEKALLHCKIGIALIVICHAPSKSWSVVSEMGSRPFLCLAAGEPSLSG